MVLSSSVILRLKLPWILFQLIMKVVPPLKQALSAQFKQVTFV